MKLSILLALLTHPASAAMLYDEAAQGDLAQGAAAPVFQPPVGINVVSGTVSYVGPVIDIDYFSIVVPQGHAASNFTYTFSNSLLVGNEQISGHVWVYTGTIPTGLTYLADIFWIARAQGSIYGQSTASPAVINTGSLTAGNYTVSVAPNGRSINGGAVPYSVSFDVNSVPEPSAAFLTFVSVTALLRRKRPKEGRNPFAPRAGTAATRREAPPPLPHALFFPTPPDLFPEH